MLQRLEHLLGTEDLTREQISFILDQAAPFQEFQKHPLKKLATLRGKTVALAFFENSTRTRISFATAAARLGADTMNLQAESSSVKKGESLLDTVRTLEAMRPDGIVIRHSSSGAPQLIADRLGMPVVNAGDGTHEHPTQALARRSYHSRPQRKTRRIESHHPRRHSAQPRRSLEYFPAQQIWREDHVVRSRHVGSARTGIARTQRAPCLAN